ncbi:nuclear transport factor 2 family protein [Mesorhizobium sp. M0659]|uniref:YybH family protein n=1 Tax=Mesorhizobium sp. M0659 TaxID=2956980 RepID=UPI00333DA0E3
MFKTYTPNEMNETFARAFNSRDLNNLLSLYEPDAILLVDGSGARATGLEAIGRELTKLLQAPGIMVSQNNFCVVHGDVALLRADFALRDGDTVIASGSTAELIRRQVDGSWLYVIDHAAGASIPPV